jgi:hypothetical protein
MVLTDPDVLPIVPVGLDRVTDLAREHLVLACGVVGRLTREVPVDEDSEFHCRGLLSYRSEQVFQANTAI